MLRSVVDNFYVVQVTPSSASNHEQNNTPLVSAATSRRDVATPDELHGSVCSVGAGDTNYMHPSAPSSADAGVATHETHARQGMVSSTIGELSAQTCHSAASSTVDVRRTDTICSTDGAEPARVRHSVTSSAHREEEATPSRTRGADTVYVRRTGTMGTGSSDSTHVRNRATSSARDEDTACVRHSKASHSTAISTIRCDAPALWASNSEDASDEELQLRLEAKYGITNSDVAMMSFASSARASRGSQRSWSQFAARSTD